MSGLLPLLAQAQAATEASSFGAAPETVGLFEIMQKGGPLMWPIVACSVVAIGVFAERMLYYRRCQMHVPEFLLGITNLLRNRNYREALERCEEGFGPVVRVVRQAILARDLSSTELREVVREVAQLQLPRLESHIGALATIGLVAPLLGLLGTVTGMIEAFIEITRASGGASVSELALGIWTALITTAAGLMVAIPSYVAYNFLVARMNSIVGDIERSGIEVIHVLTNIGGRIGVPPESPLPVKAAPVPSPVRSESKVESKVELKNEPTPPAPEAKPVEPKKETEVKKEAEVKSAEAAETKQAIVPNPAPAPAPQPEAKVEPKPEPKSEIPSPFPPRSDDFFRDPSL